MDLPVYQVDAFASRPFEGNPAAVMPLAAWLPDAQLQLIAAENNLSETAFFVPEGDGFGLRWLPPPSKWTCAGMRPSPVPMCWSIISAMIACRSASTPAVVNSRSALRMGRL